MNIKFVNQMTSYNFSENFNLSLTPEQKKIASFAVVIFSCVALAYYFYRFCNFGTNNKRNDNPDLYRPKREKIKESQLEDVFSPKQEEIKRKNKQIQETSEDKQDDVQPKAVASGRIEQSQFEDGFSPKQDVIEFEDKQIQDETFAQNPQHRKMIQVFIKSLDGRADVTIDTLSLDTKIADLKVKIESLVDVPANDQRLIFAGRQLEDDKTLKYYNIQKESTIALVERLRGD